MARTVIARVAIALGIDATLLRCRLIPGAGPLPGPETDALPPNDPAVPARELVRVGTAGTAWLEPAPGGWGGARPGFHGRDQGDGPRRPRHAEQGRHRRRQGKGLPPEVEQTPDPKVAWEEASYGPAQHYQVMLGDDRVDVVLAQGPAACRNGKARNPKAWLATTPYLAWASLPYETPDGGVAFACLGAGDEGCLFIDLAAAPGTIAITGDRDSAAHLAESLAHQLCRQVADDSSCTVVLVGDVVPDPPPSRAVLAPTLHDLGFVSDAAAPETEIVFCTLGTNEDASILARHASRSAHRVVPVVLADLPGAPWTFSITAQPAPDARS
jgi:hypothetical protein